MLPVSRVLADEHNSVRDRQDQLEIRCGTLRLTLEMLAKRGGWISMLEGQDGLKAKTPLPLFEVVLRNADGQECTVRSDSAWNEVRVQRAGQHGLQLLFGGALLPDGKKLGFGITMSLLRNDAEWQTDPSSLCLSWTRCSIPEGWTLKQATLLPLSFGVLPEETKLFYPYCSGILCSPMKEKLERRIPYPSGFGASMGWYALYGSNGGLYYAAHDPGATVKMLGMKAVPGRSLELRFDYPGTTDAKGKSVPAEANVVLAPLQGDWFTAAQRYRDWVRTESRWYPREKMGTEGRADTPQWMKELCLWMQGNPKGMEDFQQTIGVPVGFHWYNWHTIPFDNDYPHYFPARPGFQESVSSLQQKNVFIMPYINGRLWDMHDNRMQDSLFTTQALPWATKDWRANPYKESYGSKEADGTDVTFGVMCPQTELWRRKMKETVMQLCDCGVKAVYLDQIAAAPGVECFDYRHGHPLGGGTWWTRAYCELMEGIRNVKPADVALTTESNADGYIGAFDGFLVWQFQHNGQVPAFGAVYGGSIQLFGRTYSSLTGIGSKMSLAQSFVWGEQLGWASMSEGIYSTEFYTFLRKLVWLRYPFRRFFYAGQMARAPQLSGNNPEFDAQWSFGGAMHPVRNPAVMCGAWTIPAESRTLLLFANYSNQDVSLSVDYPLTDWGFNAEPLAFCRYDADGTCTPLQSLPQEIVFHAGEAFVISIEREPQT